MSRMERARDVRAVIARLASEGFVGFELDYDQESRSWKCRHPNHGNHAFRLYFAPGVVFMWGDIGEYAWRHSDADSLGWYVAQGGKAGDYPDYFLGKLRAADGPIREFYVGDAYAYIDERIAEIRAEWNEDLKNLDPADDTADNRAERAGERNAIADDIAAKRKRWDDLRAKFKEYLDEQLNSEETCWYLAWTESGFDDPPSCHGWAGHALWAWHAARTFARLHAARAIPQPVHTDGATEAVS